VYRHVLLCYDGSREGRRALKQGADVVMCMKSEAYPLAICQHAVHHAIPEAVNPMMMEHEDNRAQSLLDEGVEWLRERGVTAHGSLEYGNAVECISRTARRVNADLIVLGHKQRGKLARWWTESDEESLLGRVTCAILVAMAPDEA
jgi:nucleotide-binding universal stress UspA family protein